MIFRRFSSAVFGIKGFEFIQEVAVLLILGLLLFKLLLVALIVLLNYKHRTFQLELSGLMIVVLHPKNAYSVHRPILFLFHEFKTLYYILVSRTSTSIKLFQLLGLRWYFPIRKTLIGPYWFIPFVSIHVNFHTTTTSINWIFILLVVHSITIIEVYKDLYAYVCSYDQIPLTTGSTFNHHYKIYVCSHYKTSYVLIAPI